MAREIWTNGDDKAQTEWYAKVAEFERNEDERKLSESNRVLNFKTWSLQFQDFISNDAKHKYNEEQRNAKFNIIKSDWQYIMDGLSEADIGNLAVEINKIRHTLSNHIKTLTINSIDNSLEGWIEKDVDTPSFILKLPKGFSGNYDDLTNKPIYKKYDASNYSVVRQGDMVMLNIKPETYIPDIIGWTLPADFRPLRDICTSVTFHADPSTVWTFYCTVKPTGKIDALLWIKATASEVIHAYERMIKRNISLSYSI